MKKACIFLLSLFCIITGTASLQAAEKTIRILHVNDFHGFAEPHRSTGSEEVRGDIAILAGRLNELRADKPSLVLSAGDMIQGNNWANISYGQSSISVMNAMGFDAMTAGNHEFDFGQEVLTQRMRQARFPFLAANVKGLDGLLPYVIKEVGGVMVAIIGAVADDTPLLTHPRNVRGLTFSSHEEAVERYVRELAGVVDVIIVLTHIGHEADRRLAARVNGITAIIGGHSHTKVSRPPLINNTVVLQAWEHAKALGILDITVNEGKVTQVASRIEEIFPASGKPEPGIAALVAEYGSRINDALNRQVGEALVDLDGEHVRLQETNFGNFVADSLRETAGADIALINGGAIRTGIRKGSILMKDIFAALPFDNYVVGIRLTGSQVARALEHGVSGYEENSGSFPQVSGMSFSFNPSGAAGVRVSSIKVAGLPLDPNREYIVATNDFLAAGGDRYTVFGEALRASEDFEVSGGAMRAGKLVFSDPGRWLRDIVAGRIQRLGKISPAAENRILQIR